MFSIYKTWWENGEKQYEEVEQLDTWDEALDALYAYKEDKQKGESFYIEKN